MVKIYKPLRGSGDLATLVSVARHPQREYRKNPGAMYEAAEHVKYRRGVVPRTQSRSRKPKLYPHLRHIADPQKGTASLL